MEIFVYTPLVQSPESASRAARGRGTRDTTASPCPTTSSSSEFFRLAPSSRTRRGHRARGRCGIHLETPSADARFNSSERPGRTGALGEHAPAVVGEPGRTGLGRRVVRERPTGRAPLFRRPGTRYWSPRGDRGDLPGPVLATEALFRRCLDVRDGRGHLPHVQPATDSRRRCGPSER